MGLITMRGDRLRRAAMLSAALFVLLANVGACANTITTQEERFPPEKRIVSYINQNNIDAQCYRSGTGMAPDRSDHARAMTLFVTDGDSHDYFSSARRIEVRRDNAIYINEIVKQYGEPVRSGIVYLIVLADRNVNGVIDDGEYELIVFTLNVPAKAT